MSKMGCVGHVLACFPLELRMEASEELKASRAFMFLVLQWKVGILQLQRIQSLRI